MSAAWHAFATWGRPCHPQLSSLGDAVEHALTVTNPEWALAARVAVPVLA